MHVEISNQGKLSQNGLQEAEVFIPLHDPCTFEGEDMSVTALIRCRTAAYPLTWALCGIMGTPVSPQWEGGLELDSACGDCDNVHGATERA